MQKKKTTLLCVLDGYGLNPRTDGNAVAQAKKPVIDRLMSECPNTTLITYGEAVGLPAGQMGNSEVGHLNIGAGRVIEQWLLRIDRALAGSWLDSNEAYKKFRNTTQKSPAIHLIGLFSDGGVHSHLEHLYLLLKRLQTGFAGDIYLHLISDGRDTSPHASAEYLIGLQSYLSENPRVKIATITGRFYAMDRDKRWERTQLAAEAIMLGKGNKTQDPLQTLKANYDKNITDEFIEPIVVHEKPVAADEGVIFWNFREDRMRQIVGALCAPAFKGFQRTYAPISRDHVLCFTDYDTSLELPYLFGTLEVANHLGQWISAKGLKQLRVAETEKYPHVTYFFNAGIEEPYPGEDRKVLPSPRDVKTYDLKPEMSAAAVCETVIQGIESGQYDLIVVNFANCDMVGHTGVLPAAVKAVETVDHCLGQILQVLSRASGQALIIADHGNAEQMVNYDTGTPHTAHTTYPVPAILFGVSGNPALRSGGALCDVAPTVVKMMGLPQPAEMTGVSLY